MASATVQLNVRIDPKRHARLKARAKRDGLALAAAIEASIDLYLEKSNGSGATSPEAAPEPQRKGA